jgi:hypothetical protein
MSTAKKSPVTVAEATVQTCTVQVKALTLGKKQMTLSVFRQLPDLHLEPHLRAGAEAHLWGMVNYFWDGCGMRGEHLHIVWSDGRRLYRCCWGPLELAGVRLYGDPEALRRYGLIIATSYGESYCEPKEPVLRSPDLAAEVAAWNDLRDEHCGRLEQLFIAV